MNAPTLYDRHAIETERRATGRHSIQVLLNTSVGVTYDVH